MNKPIIVGLGEVLWDLLPRGKFLGGAPANFAFHASQLGAESIVASAIGRDDDGRAIQAQLAGLGLDTRYLQWSDAPTGTVTATLDADGKATYTIHEDTAWDDFRAHSEWDALAKHTDAVCFGSLAQRSPESRAILRRFVHMTPSHCLRLFDINLRQHYFGHATIHFSLQLAHVFKLNDEELPVVATLLALPGDEAETITALWERYPTLQLVALTRGSYGSTLFTRFRRSDHTGYPLAAGVVPDTVGAGDAFTAALAVGLLRFENLDTIHEKASRIATFVCSQPGATPAHPATESALAQRHP
ncbi:carbohydrate kinase [Armatimonas sp.]|uniref:carbohydrate kinase family protein n=1 Tax=Armatimonas sp. TaxID=1872638 RepID=UPI003752D3C9